MEKRRCIRFETASAINVEVVKPKGIEIKTAIMNVSRIGLNLFINRPLRKGQNVELDLRLPSRKEPIRAVARVKWSETKRTEKECLVGVEFVKIEKADKADLLDCVYEEWKGKIPKLRF